MKKLLVLGFVLGLGLVIARAIPITEEEETILHDALCGQVCQLRLHENMIASEKEAGKIYGTINLQRINAIQRTCYEIKKYIAEEKAKYKKATGKNFDGKCDCHLEDD